MIPCIWDDAYSFHDGRARVEQNDRTGYIDWTGELVIPLIWYFGSDFSEGLACVYAYENGYPNGYQYIDPDGNVVLRHNNNFQSCSTFFDGFADVSDYDAKTRKLINKRGTVIQSTCSEYVNAYSDGYARIRIGDKWGMISQTDETLIPAEMDKISVIPYIMSNDEAQQYLVSVVQGEKCGIFDPVSREISYCGNVTIPVSTASIFPEYNLITVKQGRLYGCINFQGQVVIPPKSKASLDFTCGLSAIHLDDKYGYIDPHGQTVIPVEWDRAYPVKNDLVLVYGSGAYHLFDISGRQIW